MSSNVMELAGGLVFFIGNECKFCVEIEFLVVILSLILCVYVGCYKYNRTSRMTLERSKNI